MFDFNFARKVGFDKFQQYKIIPFTDSLNALLVERNTKQSYYIGVVTIPANINVGFVIDGKTFRFGLHPQETTRWIYFDNVDNTDVVLTSTCIMSGYKIQPL